MIDDLGANRLYENDLHKALLEIGGLKAELDVLNGTWCKENQERGCGPCGACNPCLRAKVKAYEPFVPPYLRIPPEYLDPNDLKEVYNLFEEKKGKEGIKLLHVILDKVKEIFGIHSFTDSHLRIDDEAYDKFFLIVPTHLSVEEAYPKYDELCKFKVVATPPGFGLCILMSFERPSYENKS